MNYSGEFDGVNKSWTYSSFSAKSIIKELLWAHKLSKIITIFFLEYLLFMQATKAL